MGITGLALVLASGCALDTTDGNDDLVETSSSESAITIVPDEGIWIYDEIDPIRTNCSSNAPDAVLGSFILSVRSATSYIVFPRDGTSAFSCTLTEAKFNCPNRSTSQFTVFGLDARITVTVSATGTFTDDRHQTGKQDVGLTCVGTQCAAAGTFPCGFVHNFNGIAL